MGTPTADRPTRSGPRSWLVLLPVALLPALIVAALYEMSGRTRRRPEAANSDGSESAASPSPDQRAESGVAIAAPAETCADLRWRYLARCARDIPGRPVESGIVPGERDGDADPARARLVNARASAEVDAWLRPSRSELAEMAKRCEIRSLVPAVSEDQPPQVGEEAAAALSLSRRERELLDRTLRDLHAEVRSFATRAFAEVVGASVPAGSVTLEEMLADLQARPESGYADARRKLARERAGLENPPALGTNQPPGERLLRLWSRLGDEMERRLADELGSERAHELRFSPQATWTNRFSESGCNR